jgi:predicted ATPase
MVSFRLAATVCMTEGKRILHGTNIAKHSLSGAPGHTRKSLDASESIEINQVRTAFGIDNAKQMPIEDTVRFFIPQPEFKRLFVAKNHILLGSRGSGKTTWVRMLAYDHVVLASKENTPRTEYARDALNRNLIGIYVPASAAFAGDLRNKPWQTEEEAEKYFVWRLNLHTCSALTHVLSSCIEQYVQDPHLRHQVQADLCIALARAWTDGSSSCTSFEGLRLILSEVELRHQSALRRSRMTSAITPEYIDHFDTDLLLPLRHSINVLRTLISLPTGTVWMVCLDEVEYLTEAHHRILNTQMRTASGDLVFKIATMPFAHHTLATNLDDPVREGNDFEYVYVDREPIDSRGGSSEGEFLMFAREMFKIRMSHKSPQLAGLTLKALLGGSPLIDEKNVGTREEFDNFMTLLRKHANPLTIARAERLQGTSKFKNEIVRKMHGALLLRDAVQNLHGNARLRIYSGEATIVRCCDGNARRLMRVINQLVQRIHIDERGIRNLPLDSSVQNEVIETIARDTLSRTQSEPPNGALTAQYLKAIGDFLKFQFSNSARRLGSDQVTSVSIEEDDGEDIQRFIKQAIQLSLMIPSKDVALMTPNRKCTGTFHLAFLFAPLFHVLPRRNDSVRLTRVLSRGLHINQPSDDIQQLLL